MTASNRPHRGNGRGAATRHVVVRTIDRAPAATVDALAPIGTATIHEAIGRRGYLGPDITPIQRGRGSRVPPSPCPATPATTS